MCSTRIIALCALVVSVWAANGSAGADYAAPDDGLMLRAGSVDTTAAANLLADPSALGGVAAAVLLWVGLGATQTACQNAAHRKPLPAYLIDVSHHLACLVVMGAIIGGWR